MKWRKSRTGCHLFLTTSNSEKVKLSVENPVLFAQELLKHSGPEPLREGNVTGPRRDTVLACLCLVQPLSVSSQREGTQHHLGHWPSEQHGHRFHPVFYLPVLLHMSLVANPNQNCKRGIPGNMVLSSLRCMELTRGIQFFPMLKNLCPLGTLSQGDYELQLSPQEVWVLSVSEV